MISHDAQPKLVDTWWLPFTIWNKKHVGFTFAYKGDQYLIYEGLQPLANQIAQDARLKIADASLMFKIRMRQAVDVSMFCLWQQLILKKKIMSY